MCIITVIHLRITRRRPRMNKKTELILSMSELVAILEESPVVREQLGKGISNCALTMGGLNEDKTYTDLPKYLSISIDHKVPKAASDYGEVSYGEGVVGDYIQDEETK